MKMDLKIEGDHNDWPDGIKKTRPRMLVLSVLEEADKPLSALDIFSQIERSGDSVWLSTVYRILELFVKKGMVNKLTIMNNEMVVYELNRFQHKHYAVCISCHKIIPMDNCPMEKFFPMLEDDNFHVMGHNLEIYGCCKDCFPKKSGN